MLNYSFMYRPKYFENNEIEFHLEFMRQYPFAMLVTSDNNKPWVTHIPFVAEYNHQKIELYSHISLANPQKGHLDGREILVVFREPHAYISPKFYKEFNNVPTWNYLAVHAYGVAEVYSQKVDLIQLQEKMILNFEPDYMEQWKALPESYKEDLLNGIVGFKINVSEVLGKEKLSQNKSIENQRNIANQLIQSEDVLAKEISKRISDKLKD